MINKSEVFVEPFTDLEEVFGDEGANNEQTPTLLTRAKEAVTETATSALEGAKSLLTRKVGVAAMTGIVAAGGLVGGGKAFAAEEAPTAAHNTETVAVAQHQPKQQPAEVAPKAAKHVAGEPQPTPQGLKTQNDKNAKTAYDYFVGKGLSSEQSAGIVGNLVQESRVDPNAENTAGNAGGSVFQWEGDRWSGFEDYAAKHGKDTSDLHTQLAYGWHELTTTEEPALTDIKQAKDPGTAAVVFVEEDERAGDPQTQNRVANANKVHHAASTGWQTPPVSQ